MICIQEAWNFSICIMPLREYCIHPEDYYDDWTWPSTQSDCTLFTSGLKMQYTVLKLYVVCNSSCEASVG